MWTYPTSKHSTYYVKQHANWEKKKKIFWEQKAEWKKESIWGQLTFFSRPHMSLALWSAKLRKFRTVLHRTGICNIHIVNGPNKHLVAMTVSKLHITHPHILIALQQPLYGYPKWNSAVCSNWLKRAHTAKDNNMVGCV